MLFFGRKEKVSEVTRGRSFDRYHFWLETVATQTLAKVSCVPHTMKGSVVLATAADP
jgi:hypothetical protein